MSIYSRYRARFLTRPFSKRRAVLSGCRNRSVKRGQNSSGRRARPKPQRAGAWHVEWLEHRYLLAVAAELNGGSIPLFTGDAANDSVTLRVGSNGNLEY